MPNRRCPSLRTGLWAAGQRRLEVVRSFVAIDLPETLRDRLRELSSRLAKRVPAGTVRWVRPESIHLTLKFLGDVSSESLGQIVDLMRQAASPVSPFSLRIGGLGCFPSPRRPRVLWVGIHEASGALAALQETLEGGFERLGYRREARGFSPHLTLGRVRQEAGAAAAQAAGASVADEPSPDLGEIAVDAICLIRSELRPSGAVYTRLAQIALEGGR
jgi:2'-5' RNA ligase